MKSRLLAGLALTALVAAGCGTSAPTAVDAPTIEAGHDLASSSVMVVPPDHHQRNFRTHLAGRNEVPAVETRAQGQVIFQVAGEPPVIKYKVIVANIKDIIGAHIHLAPAGANGPIVVNLLGPPPGPGRRQGVLAEGEITPGDLQGPLMGMPLHMLLGAMEDGNAYVNVHTAANPSGEVRGQIH